MNGGKGVHVLGINDESSIVLHQCLYVESVFGGRKGPKNICRGVRANPLCKDADLLVLVE